MDDEPAVVRRQPLEVGVPGRRRRQVRGGVGRNGFGVEAGPAAGGGQQTGHRRLAVHPRQHDLVPRAERARPERLREGRGDGRLGAANRGDVQVFRTNAVRLRFARPEPFQPAERQSRPPPAEPAHRAARGRRGAPPRGTGRRTAVGLRAGRRRAATSAARSETGSVRRSRSRSAGAPGRAQRLQSRRVGNDGAGEADAGDGDGGVHAVKRPWRRRVGAAWPRRGSPDTSRRRRSRTCRAAPAAGRGGAGRS